MLTQIGDIWEEECKEEEVEVITDGYADEVDCHKHTITLPNFASQISISRVTVLLCLTHTSLEHKP